MGNPKQAPKRPKDRYRQQYGVIVLCEGEAHQADVYRALKAGGYRVKVVCT